MFLSLFVALAAFLISLIGTRLLVIAFRSQQLWLDKPNARSNHKIPVPRGGGLAVVISLIIPMLIADIDLRIILSILLLTSVSLLDDLIGVNPLIRLLIQIIAVVIALSQFPEPAFISQYFPSYLPSSFGKIIIAIFWIWFINLFNFMDGIDGISATEMLSIGTGLAILIAIVGKFPNHLSEYSMIIAASGLGFWWWNKQPAKIFLGDVGSIPIGFIIGYIMLLAAYSGYGISALILAAYYLADSGITIAARIWRREKIWQAHSLHYYQKAARNGWSHHAITNVIAGVNVLLGYLAVQAAIYPDMIWLFSALALMLVFMAMGVFANYHDKSANDKLTEKSANQNKK